MRSMSGPARWKRILCFSLIGITLCVHFYVVSNTQAVAYFRNKLTSYTDSLAWTYRSRPPEKVHVLLVSYARTGSSFFGDLLQSHPKAFYYFEPLHFIRDSVVTNNFTEARSLMHGLFTCNVTNVPGFLDWQKAHPNFMKLKRSVRFWNNCSVEESCYNATYVDDYCSKHYAVIMKTIRLPLRHAVPMFQEYPDLNLKIIYLMRDPRGTLNSRHKSRIKAWCKDDPMCIEPRKFCSVLEEDLRVSCSLLAERPNDFMIIRYEDLSRNSSAVSKRLMSFLGLPEPDPEVESFIRSHTSMNVSRPDRKLLNGVDFLYATFRNSTEAAFRWRQETTFAETLSIQKDCSEVLQKFGYHIYKTSGALRSNIYLDQPLLDGVRYSCRES